MACVCVMLCVRVHRIVVMDVEFSMCMCDCECVSIVSSSWVLSFLGAPRRRLNDYAAAKAVVLWDFAHARVRACARNAADMSSGLHGKSLIWSHDSSVICGRCLAW